MTNTPTPTLPTFPVEPLPTLPVELNVFELGFLYAVLRSSFPDDWAAIAIREKLYLAMGTKAK
jgi:hypothetical protein